MTIDNKILERILGEKDDISHMRILIIKSSLEYDYVNVDYQIVKFGVASKNEDRKKSFPYSEYEERSLEIGRRVKLNKILYTDE